MFCDVRIKVESEKFSAHRLVLSTCSDYFHDIFCSPNHDNSSQNSGHIDVITLSNISPSIMELVLDSMYSGRLQVNEYNFRDLLYAASHLGYHTMQDACDDFLQGLLSKRSCKSLLQQAFAYNLKGLCEACFKLIAHNFEELASGEDYLQLNLEQLVTLLSRSDLNARNELLVFHRMMDWINHDIPNRYVDYPF